jgi:hypothetical protein
MNQSNAWKANDLSARQDIPPLLLNVKVHYHVYNSPPLYPILSQKNPVHTLPLYIFKIKFTISLTIKPKSPMESVPFKFSH